MKVITDQDVQHAMSNTSPQVLNIVSADETSRLSFSLAQKYGVVESIQGIVVEEITFLLLNMCSEEETTDRISERTGIDHESAVALLQEFSKAMTEKIIPMINAQEEDEPTLPIDQIPWEQEEDTLASTSTLSGNNVIELIPANPLPIANKNVQEQLSLRPEGAPTETMSREKEVVLGTLPEANRAMREKLTLHPEGVTRTGLVRDPNTPLTREEVMSALAPRRTMASDIATLAKEKSHIQK